MAEEKNTKEKKEPKPKAKDEKPKKSEVLDITTMDEYKAIVKELNIAHEQTDQALTLVKNFKDDIDRIRERNKDFEAQKTQEITEDIAKTLLPILDNFEQAFSKIEEDENTKGFRMIQKQMEKAVAKLGVKEIEDNDKFDPDFHEAIFVEPAPTKSKSGKISGIIQKGYTLNDKVIRHTLVRVYE